jgi:hypothetical protein
MENILERIMKLIFLILMPFIINAQGFTTLGIIMGDVAPDTLGVELVVNGDMELNSNWTGQATEAGDTTVQSAAQKHGGSYSWRIKVDATVEGIRSDDFQVTSGETYYVGFWVYMIDDISLSLTAYNGRYTLSKGIDPPLGVWTYYVYAAPATGTGAEKFMVRSSGLGGEFFVDDVSVKQKTN